MSSKAILIPLDLGRASDYNPTVFPLMKDNSTLKASQIYLEYTLNELINMEKMVKKNPNFKKELREAKRRYDQLAETLKKIGERKETRNPFKAFSRYRRNRLFVAATEKFNRQVKTTSETVRRYTCLSGSQVSVVTDNVVPVERGDSSTEQRDLSGIAIRCDQDIDDKLREIIEGVASALTQQNPFDDPVEMDNDSEPSTESNDESTSLPRGDIGSSRSSTDSNVKSITYVDIRECRISTSSVSGICSPTLKTLSVGGHDNIGYVTQNIENSSSSETS